MTPRLLLAALLLLPAFAEHAEAAPDRGWDYEVRFDEALDRAEVRCCFRRFWPKRLVSNREGALPATTFPLVAGAARLERSGENGFAPVGHGPRVPCLAWRVDLTKVQDRRRHDRILTRVGRDRVFAPGILFLRPALWPEDARVTVRFVLPEGVRIAAPWPRTGDGAWELDRYATKLLGLVAVGRFAEDTLKVHGAEIDIAVLDAPHQASRQGIRAWIEGAVGAVAGLYGTFPTPRLVVLVNPMPARSPPVVFGTAMRAGGGHVHMLLAAAARDREMPGEWIGVHEMMHLGMPWTYDADAWLQEGFVTYYQEVLRARAGFLSEQEAWENIDEGFGRGRRRGGIRSLALESRDMGKEHNYHRVYWAGAAMALLIDVEIRRRSKGRQSLDDVMRFWHERYGGTRGPYRGVDLMRMVDRWLGGPICATIAEACLRENEFPDESKVYAALGIRSRGGRVVLDDKAPEAALRRAIMRPATVPRTTARTR